MEITMKHKNTVIFDMDGVILDSEKIVLYSWKKVAEQYDLPHIEETMKKCIGLNYDAANKVFTKEYNGKYDFDFLKPKTSAYYYHYVEQHGLPLKPGIRSLLCYLKEQNYKTAVASSTRIAVVEKEMQQTGLYDYFDRLVGGDMIKNSKPAPDIFLHAAQILQSEPDDCYVIEDSYNGIRAAYAAGMSPLMVPDLLPATDEMRELATGIFKDLTQVQEYMNNIITEE